MNVVPLVDEGLGNSGYVVNLGDGGALVVDPERDPRPYLAALRQHGLAPRFAVETHLHADFVSGGRELAARGARLLAPAGGELAYDHHPSRDGDELDVGGLVLEVVATPGHTPEHLAYLLRDGGTPVALFSGGTLMAGGVARPDLIGPEQTEPLARAAYRAISERLLTLPDDLPVHPTHGGGSFCSAAVGGQRTTTIGRERAANPLLAGAPDEDTSVARLLGGLGTYPPYFLELRDVNRAGVQVHGTSPPGLPGSLSNPWRAQFATWLGWLVPRDRPVVFVADLTVDRDDLVWAAHTIGYERLVGELAGGIGAWDAGGRPLARTPLVAGGRDEARQVVDIRQRAELTAGHVPGALHVELGSLTEGADAVPDGPLLVHCGHGERAMSAASLLERAGRRDVAVLAGGPSELGDLEAEA